MQYNCNIFSGAGMENFPISTYPEDVQMNDYDVFILLTRGRFQENDKIILQEIEKLEKTCYFARTHTDVDLQEFAYDNPEIFIYWQLHTGFVVMKVHVFI